MAKSKAQRMKEYRERKKAALGEEWLRRENRRVKSYFIPVSELSKEKQTSRRLRNRRDAQNYRIKKRASKNTGSSTITVPEATASSSRDTEDDNGVSSTTTEIPTTPLVVKLPGINVRSSSGKKRRTRALAKAYREIEKLTDKNKEVNRKLNTARKRISRLEKKAPLTPRSKTDRLIKQSGISPSRAKEIKKKLVYAECLSEEIKEAQRKNPRKLRAINVVVSGKLIAKYRLKAMLQKAANVNRKKGHVHNKDIFNFMNRKSPDEVQRRKRETLIHDFLERDDNSRLLPGKSDAVKDGKGVNNKKQKRVLNDYLHNLHLKFVAETGCKVSLATFCRCRPRHISLVNFASRSVCLCQKHQNFALKLRCLKLLKVTSCTSPDKFIEIYPDEEQLEIVLSKLPEDTVKYQEWKRVKCRDGKERMKVAESEVEKEEFVKIMKTTHSDFIDHVDKVKKQYSSIKKMKEKLVPGHAIVQMDFAENYSCESMEEVQSAYWNNTMVTLHPAIVYYKTEDETLQHISTVFVSEILSHNSAMVCAIIKDLMSQISGRIPGLKYIHFWTDSPLSQYRNKTIFDLVGNFEKLFGVSASWHYFEAGHGKGPCDGIGGTTKRNADNAVKQGKVVIQDATDFIAWANTTETQIEYHYITPEAFESSKTEVESRNKKLKPIKGTLQLHAVVSASDGQLMVRKTTCVCDKCFGENGFNINTTCVWEKHRITVGETETQPDRNDQNARSVDAQDEMRVHPEAEKRHSEDHVTPEVGRFAIVLYEHVCYVGKILEIDDEDGEVHVMFMENSGKVEGRFRWPRNEDKLWTLKSAVLKLINDPVATGKSRRIFQVEDETLSFIKDYQQK